MSSQVFHQRIGFAQIPVLLLWLLYWVAIAVFMNDGTSADAMSLNRIVAFCMILEPHLHAFLV